MLYAVYLISRRHTPTYQNACIYLGKKLFFPFYFNALKALRARFLWGILRSSPVENESTAMPLPYLTDVEVLEIVKPLTQPAAIVRWFSDHGFYVNKKPNGMPLIGRVHFESRMAASAANEPCGRDSQDIMPDVEAFTARYKRKCNPS